MSLPLPLRLAGRDLRGGLRGFAIFLLCLMLGVAAIAAVGTVRDAIETAIRDQGAVLLGGDAEMSFTYRFATAAEREFMATHAERLSEIVDFRSMAVTGAAGDGERALTQVKAVDAAYPLRGQLTLDPPMAPAAAFAAAGGIPGAVMDRVLAERLGLAPGDTFRLGTKTFRLAAFIVREPDTSGGFILGPRTILRAADLDGSGLISPGSLFDTKYRLDLKPGERLPDLERRAEAAFRETGMQWQDARNGAPGMRRFVDRMGSFLILIGLAGLAVGGVGIGAAVRSYLGEKIATIAILKAMGAESRTIFATYLAQIGALAVLGVVAGLALGAAAPILAGPMIARGLPIPVTVGLSWRPLAEAALYGILTAGLFALWPLARTRDVRAAALFRDLGTGGRSLPGIGLSLVLAAIAALIVVLAVSFSGVPHLAYGTLGGVAAALALLALSAAALRWLARQSEARARGRPALRLALSAIGAPGGEVTAVVLALGLGLSVLASVGQIDANLRASIAEDLPDVAPSFFFVDIQPDQVDGFLQRVEADPAVSRVDSAPMLRGVLTRINGRDAREVAGDHWVLRGDRGLTYSAAPPPRTKITEGAWWPADYAGPPQMSFAAEEAAEMGLGLGDRVTVNVLGRDIEAEITSFRLVEFETAGIGFVMAMNPAALAGAPHSYIATVYAESAAEAAILRDVTDAWPNVTAVPVKEAIGRVSEALAAIATATAIAAGVTLLTGLVVLVGAAAAGERARVFEAAILKTLGATRRTILLSFALRSALMGAAAGLVAVGFGAAAGWAVMTFVMDGSFRFEPLSAVAIILGGALTTLLAGLAFALRPLGARPARVLRAQD